VAQLTSDIKERGSSVLRRSATRKRVLVVDDNRDSARLLGVLVEQLGHTAATAYDGDSAITLAREFQPEIVLLDLILPDADGCDIALGIRAQPGLQECRIFIVSAYGSPEDRFRSLSAGCEEHYTKPVHPEILISLLGDLSR
jgi:CheY-like chemotaxis protein